MQCPALLQTTEKLLRLVLESRNIHTGMPLTNLLRQSLAGSPLVLVTAFQVSGFKLAVLLK